jgi:hypothetical protein
VVPPSGKKSKYVNIPAKKHGASSAHTIDISCALVDISCAHVYLSGDLVDIG